MYPPRVRPFVRLAFVFSLLAACGPAAVEAPPPPPPAAPAVAPIPYTVDQLREGCPAGRVIVFRMEMAGKPAVRRAMRFVAVTPEGADVETTVVDDTGAPLKAPSREHASWEELRKHGAFPQDRTTIAEDTVTTPAGTFACSVYTVRGEGDEVKRFWFAKTMPGPPVLFFTEKGGARAMTSTLVAADPGGGAAPPVVPLAHLDAEAAKAPEVLAMAKMASAYGPSLSPDGKRVAFVSNQSGVPEVWIAPAIGGAPSRVTRFEQPVQRVVWSPDGAWLAVTVAPGGGMNTQIWLIHPDGSGAKRVTAGGKDNNFLHRFSHDGKLLAYSSNVRDPKTTDAYLLDVASGQSTRIADLEGIGWVADLTPDGGRALVGRLRARGNSDLYVVDARGKGGAEIHVTPHEGTATVSGAHFAKDGRSVYFAGDLGRDRAALMQVALGPKGAGAPAVLAARDDADLESLDIDEAGKRALLGWNVAGRVELQLFDLGRRAVVATPQAPTPVVFGGGFARDGSRVALVGTTADAPTEVYVLDRAGRRFTRVTESRHEGVDLGKLVRPELVRYPGKDGLPLTGWLYRVKGSARPGPMVLSFHGGPEGQERPILNPTYQALLARGIAVLAPNVRGSSGFGKRFVNLDNGALRKNAVADIRASVEFAVTAGVADPKRIGIMGGSYGGYMTMAGLTEFPDLFAAGADLFGIVNFETFFAKSEPWMKTISRVEYGDPDTQADLLRELSPLHKLDRVRAPTLVLHGANDTNVPVVEAEQVVHGLLGRGVPVEYVLFPDEGHGFRKEPNRVRTTTAIVAWFERYLAQR